MGSMQGALSNRTLGATRQQGKGSCYAVNKPRTVLMGVALRTKAPQVGEGASLRVPYWDCTRLQGAMLMLVLYSTGMWLLLVLQQC